MRTACRFCGRPIKRKMSVYVETAGTVGIHLAGVLMAIDVSGSDTNLQDIVRDGAGPANALHQTAHTGDEGTDAGVLTLMQAWFDAAEQAIDQAKRDYPEKWAATLGDGERYGQKAAELVRLA